jgi:hypothetical protein
MATHSEGSLGLALERLSLSVETSTFLHGLLTQVTNVPPYPSQWLTSPQLLPLSFVIEVIRPRGWCKLKDHHPLSQLRSKF